ncbi:MAG TPA: adventurous gliding motility protein GltG [Anaeromyxobacteraceae bacterium]|nr:adventurous gliding motility protein GltG [Anaeromyxobacteraceae bacterium]
MATPLTLKVFRGQDLLRSESFSRDIIKIGRLASAHLCLDDERVARIHSVIEVAADGSVSIIDMGSAEGTFVNGKKVSRGPLRTGDEIGVGGLRIVVVNGGAAAVSRPAAAPAAAPAPTSPAREPEATGAEPAPESRALPEEPHPAQAPAASAAAPAGRALEDIPVDEGPPEEAPAHSRAEPAPAPAARAKKPKPEPAPRPAARAKKPKAEPAPRGEAPVVRRVQKAARAEPEEAYGEGVGAELRFLWGENLLDAGTFVEPKSPVLVGETEKCHFQIPASGLPVPEFPVLRFEDQEYRITFARGMTGQVEERGAATPLSQLVKERRVSAVDGGLEGAFAVPVPASGAVRVEFGSGVRMEAKLKRPPKPAVVPWWERVNYQFLNLFLILFFIQAGFIVAANTWPYDTDTVADDLFKNPSRMAKFIIKPPEAQPKRNPYLERLQKELRREEPGEMAERHKGTEGQMGKKDAPKTNARSAPQAIDPNAKDIVKNTGLVALLGRGRSGGLSTIFGQGGLGGDLKGAIGNMFGPVVGDSYGLGGLGLKGSGTGGGGQGETIGIGAVGTKGRGGGLGSYGTGVGGLGKKSDRDVSIQAGTAAVVGSIDKELIRKVIQEHASQIRYCYEQELQRDPKLEGKVSIRWIINAEGRVQGTQVDTGATTLQNGQIHSCMMDRIASWEFPKPKGGGIAVITYPWILRSSGGAGG